LLAPCSLKRDRIKFLKGKATAPAGGHNGATVFSDVRGAHPNRHGPAICRGTGQLADGQLRPAHDVVCVTSAGNR
jgi:hypothetical protein